MFLVTLCVHERGDTDWERPMSLPSSSIDMDRVQHIAAFADGDRGGNPAGVYVADAMPSEGDMRTLAAHLGYSETAFVVPEDDSFRVRDFSPESEVPFCGHATIALGSALAAREGAGVFELQLNDATISVEAFDEAGAQVVALQSPPTHSAPAEPELLSEALTLFSLSADDLDSRFVPSRAHGGADHLLLMLNSRSAVAGMSYSGFRRTRPQVRQRRRWPGTCAMSAGPTAATFRWCRAKTWGNARCCVLSSRTSPVARSGCRAAPAR